jgi:Protein of unknown function (DUF2946)
VARPARQTKGLSLHSAITAFALFAFLFSGFATQTHIHIPAQAALDQHAAVETAAKASASLERDQQPRAPADDFDHCPLCLDFLAFGAYVAPVPFALPLPILTATELPALTRSITVLRAVAHNWRSRAPPLA